MIYIGKILEEESKAGAEVLENYQNIMHRLTARVLPPSAISGKNQNWKRCESCWKLLGFRKRVRMHVMESWKC